MKPCISQATTMNAATRADLRAYGRGGWSLVELWLTKVEDYLRENSVADLRGVLEKHGLTAAAAAGQGGLLLSRGAERDAHWDLFRRRLALLKELEVPVLVVAVDFHRAPTAEDYPLAAASLAEAGALAGDHGVKIALEFQRGASFCASLDTTLALIAQCGSPHVGVCLDLFHYYTGPSKFEDLGYLTRENLAWVQICDLAGTPRELAGDADRIFPGEGDFQITPILDHLGSIGYDGPVSLEVLNPSLWAAPVDRIADFGHQATVRALGRWYEAEDVGGPSGSGGR
jgi:sugar phosphate isomerase/epimerase